MHDRIGQEISVKMVYHRRLLLLVLLQFASFVTSQDLDFGGDANTTTFLRLVNLNSATTSSSTLEGRLEFYYNGNWTKVCSHGFSDTNAQVVCFSLGFGRTGRFIRNIYGTVDGPALFDYIHCRGDEDRIVDCGHSRYFNNFYCDEYAAVRCSNSSIFLRLFDPDSVTTDNRTMEARLEIYYNGVWGAVCVEKVSDAIAQVVCVSLGLGVTGISSDKSFGPGSGEVLLDSIECRGNERSITDCSHSSWGSNNCDNREVIAVSCSDSFIFTRLVNPSSSSTGNDTMEGRLEIYYNGVWGGVCGDGHFTDIEASVVCASFGFGRTGKYIGNSFGSGNGTTWFHSVTCSGNELSITYCEHPSWGTENYCFLEEVAISCDNSPIFVRLSNPNSDSTSNDTKEGRLEIYFNGVWGTVCDSAFSDVEAQVVCESLGFGGIGRYNGSFYGPGDGPILLDTIVCTGNEPSILDCPHSKWAPSWPNCDHSTDVSISCHGTDTTTAAIHPLTEPTPSSTTSDMTFLTTSERTTSSFVMTTSEPTITSDENSTPFLRLVNPNSTTRSNITMEGRVEFYYNGNWGRVCSHGFSDTVAQVACFSLGFGRTGRFIQNIFGYIDGPALFDNINCRGDELSIADCSYTRSDFNNFCDEYAAIRCSNSSIFLRLFDQQSVTTDNKTREGLLQIYYNGGWMTVCVDKVSDAIAQVVCVSLGLGYGLRMNSTSSSQYSYGPGIMKQHPP